MTFLTIFEKSNGTETATYEETIQFYTQLALSYPSINIQSIGETDSGLPLHYITYNPDSQFNFEKIRNSKAIILINNGIHPGESDGIDATMMLFRDLANGKIDPPRQTVLVTIPIYNTGGSLNRNSTTRTNQNGPKSYGFRGNGRNYDLNRDFIKCDTKNARTFAQLFHQIKPDVFIDNHVSNGADYQYTLTHLFTQHNKLGGELGEYLNDHMMPILETKLATKHWDITPYVNVFNEVPEAGFSQFFDLPRYSTGYTSLFNTLGMMIETHMLKPYKQRVEGTYELMKSMLEIVETDGSKIKMMRSKAVSKIMTLDKYPLDWTIDSSKTSLLNFKGYEATITPSKFTGKSRLKYDRNRPFTKEVLYQNYYKPTTEVTIPKAYIIPQSWWTVIDLLKLNRVEMSAFQNDTTLTVENYRIASYDSRKQPYEGHYQHFDTKITSNTTTINFRKGDFYIDLNQEAFRYLLETLEPQAPDSFFNWNFFDTILQQKEGFSPYVWEDIAYEMLSKNEDLKVEFEKKKRENTAFSDNWYEQLDWLHKQSPHYEKAHLNYPVYRVN